MEYGYYEQTGSPLRGRTLGELREFLARAEYNKKKTSAVSKRRRGGRRHAGLYPGQSGD